MTTLRSRVIRKKAFLRQIYEEWYKCILRSLPVDIEGQVVELGTGGGFLKQIAPNLITSDILRTSNVDMVLSAQNLPFHNSALKSIVMVDVFHHLNNPQKFLSEATRCLKPGGAIVMVEPWSTRWSRLVYRHLHHEPFDPSAREWGCPKGGPLSQANSALPWIVFRRDIEIFERLFPELQLLKVKEFMPFSYLLSGGVSLRSLLPGFLFGVFRRFENSLTPLMSSLAMFAEIILVRK